VEQSLLEQLAFTGHRNVRVFNLSMPALTSRDGWLQYAARANNAPPEIFREDYSHYSWYEIVNMLSAYHHRAHFALPYTVRYLGLRARQMMMATLTIHATSRSPDLQRSSRTSCRR
jgi:hypothetical protein